MWKLEHVTINVKTLNESLAFYKDLMGLEYLNSIDMEDHTLTYLKLTEETDLELISYKNDTGLVQTRGTERGILRHLALEVTEIQRLYCKLSHGGAIIRMAPQYIEKLKSMRMLVEDPNGIELEFIEYQDKNI